MGKPKVKIKDAQIFWVNGQYRLQGEVIDHPRFPKNMTVITSTIVKIITKNTEYILVD
jgi:hypothetical protein